MSLAQLVALLGLDEVARRAGISPGTLKRWLRRGPSAAGARILSGIARRHLASKKSAATKKRRRSFRDRVPMPDRPNQTINDERTPDLTPEQVKPGEPPVAAGAGVYEEGRERLETERYIGEVHTFTVGLPAVEVDGDGLADTVVRVWQQSGRTFARTIFLFFRFIPFNPLYKGEMIRKQGTWQDWWNSTPALGSMQSIAQSVLNCIEDAQRAAETRVIWIEQMQVHVFDDREDLPDIGSIMGRQLR